MRRVLRYDWLALGNLMEGSQYFAVTSVSGANNDRIAHLPTMADKPVADWPAGFIVRETVEFELPDDSPPGNYTITVGWYDGGSFYAAKTDERSQIGNSFQVTTVTVP